VVEHANPSGEPQVQRRRSTRVVQTVPITVSGTDALGQPFKERTSALVINCHGCKYQSKHYVLKNNTITLEVAHPDAGQPPRNIRARVVWVQRPRTVQELFQVAVQLEIPGNVWGVAFPPEDWFPYPEEAGPSIPAPAAPEAKAEPKPESRREALPEAPAGKVRMLPLPPSAPPEALAALEGRVAQMIAEARSEIQTLTKEAATRTVTAETATLLREIETQLRAAARKTVESVSAQYLDEAVERAVARIEESRKLTNGALREKWQSDFEAVTAEVSEKLAQRFTASEQDLHQRFRAQLEQAIEQATGRLAEIEQRMEGLRIEISGGAAATQARLEALRSELAAAERSASSFMEALRTGLKSGEESAAAQLESLRAGLATAKGDTESQLLALREQFADADSAAKASVHSLRAGIESAAAAAQLRLEAFRNELDAAADELQRRRQPVLDNLSEATRQELQRLEEAIRGFRAQVTAVERDDIDRLRTIWREQLESDMTMAGEEWNSMVSGAVSSASQKLARQWAELSDRASLEARQQMSLKLGALRQSFREATADAQQTLLAVRRDLEQDLFRAKGSLDELRSASARAAADAARIEELRRTVTAQLEQQFQQALAQHMGAVSNHSSAELAGAKQTLSALAADLARIAIAHRDSVALQSQARMVDLQQRADALSTEAAGRMAQHLTAMAETAQRTQAEIATQSTRQTRETAEQLAERSRTHLDEMNRQSEALLADAISRIQPVLGAEGSRSVERAVAEMDRQLTPRMQTVERLVADLASSQQRAEEYLLRHRERLHQLSEEYVTQADHRLRETRAAIEKEWETVSRAQLEKCLAELEEKSTEATHTTFEALYKAADWYQKKAQTSMQSAMEKVTEQATDKLRERAGEMSRVFAGELDHYSRSYTDHTRALLDESAREIVAKNRQTLDQAALTSGAAFGDEVHRIATEKLHLFGEESSATRDHMISAMDTHAERVQNRWVEFAGRSFTDFQEKIAARANEQLATARKDFQASLLPILEAWRADREAKHKEWLERLDAAARETLETVNRSTGESMQQFQQRLQNTSNTWMVASVTTLNQHSKTVMDTLASAAEARLREACSLALTGMAQTFSDQMRAISAQLTALPPPPAEEPK
jgi:hypothetical protein